MPVIRQTTYSRPPFLQFNGDWQTIIPSFRRVSDVTYERERITTPDDDFLDLDWIDRGSDRLVIITHGLEGSSDRPYMLGTAKIFSQNGWDVIAWNCRSCSGELNRNLRLYNHGDIEDIDTVLNHALRRKNYARVALVGYSMGGNISLKYASVKKHPSVKGVVAYSCPLHMRSSIEVLNTPSRWIYKKLFHRGIMPKLMQKAALFPEKIRKEDIQNAKTWHQQQELFFVKVNGYANLDDFYEKGSAVNFIPDIQVPALIVQAQNDPMLSPECLPYALAEKHPHIYLETPKQGGHCGFMLPNDRAFTWAEYRALSFLN